MALANYLDVTCDIERATAVADSTGSNVPTFAARLSAIPCTIYPNNMPRQSGDFSRPDSLADYCVVTASDVAATVQDRVNIKSGPLAGRYPVVGYIVYANSKFSSDVVYLTLVQRRNLG